MLRALPTITIFKVENTLNILII